LNIRNAFRLALAMLLLTARPALGEILPDPDALVARIGTPPVSVTVVEPHMSDANRTVTAAYIGYPAEILFREIFGEDWHLTGDTIEFRALDGYVSRIDVPRFEEGMAFIVFARGDGGEFTVDNEAQREEDVPLGPYYLVWDTVTFPELRAEGAGDWPYQVSEVFAVNVSDAALFPEGLRAEFHDGAELAKTHCLNCHQVNGYGGNKFPGNLAAITKGLSQDYFIQWVLDPASQREATTMPALAPQLDEAERTRIAEALYAYLNAAPVLE